MYSSTRVKPRVWKFTKQNKSGHSSIFEWTTTDSDLETQKKRICVNGARDQRIVILLGIVRNDGDDTIRSDNQTTIYWGYFKLLLTAAALWPAILPDSM